jgi:hypothetical protein
MIPTFENAGFASVELLAIHSPAGGNGEDEEEEQKEGEGASISRH